MKYSNYLSVVMPAYNEESIIYDNLLKAADIIEKFAVDYYIIAVNDGSSDKTEEKMKLAAAKNPRIKVISYEDNQGKGYAVRRGILASRAEYTAFLDSDLELPPYLLEGYLSAIKEESADICIGSKMHNDSKIEYSFVRKVFSFGYYALLKLLFHMNLKDTQTGIKLFRTEKIQPVIKQVKNKGFSFDIEILVTADYYGCKIIERPVELISTREDTGTKSKISIKQVFIMFSDTIKIKKRLKRLRKS